MLDKCFAHDTVEEIMDALVSVFFLPFFCLSDLKQVFDFSPVNLEAIRCLWYFIVNNFVRKARHLRQMMHGAIPH